MALLASACVFHEFDIADAPSLVFSIAGDGGHKRSGRLTYVERCAYYYLHYYLASSSVSKQKDRLQKYLKRPATPHATQLISSISCNESWCEQT